MENWSCVMIEAKTKAPADIPAPRPGYVAWFADIAGIWKMKLPDGSVRNAQGDPGLKGDTGLQGVKGDTGLQGVKGDTGLQGVKGDTGLQGVKGDTGLQGVKGDTGLQGVKGDTGLQGVKGDTGLQGNQGAAAFSLVFNQVVATAAIGNVETAVGSLNIPANTLQVGDTITIEAWGRYTSTATASQSSGRVRIGATALGGAVCGSGDFGNGAIARSQFIFHTRAQMTIQSIGATGAAIGLWMEERSVATTVTNSQTGLTTAINTTVPLICSLTDISGLAGATKTYDICRIALVR